MRNSYHTQQRCALLAFLSAHADEQFTVEQLLAAMGDEAPGRSTVYRALDQSVEEGTVRRFAPESGGSAAYQAMDPGHCDAHLHLKCVQCGRIYHLDCHFMDEVRAHLMAEHGFTLQCEGSVLYGLCRHCAQNAAPSATEEQPAKKCACCVDTDKNP